jgi:trk system potassium uptake protein TrkA
MEKMRMSRFDLLSGRQINIIVGCGWLGSNIATMLSAHNQSVVIIDTDKDAFRKLGANYSGFTVEADGTDIDVLRKADIDRASSMVVVTDDDNVNIMIAQIAKVMFNIPLVVVRLHNPDKEVIVGNYGIKTIDPSKLSMQAFEQMLAKTEGN